MKDFLARAWQNPKTTFGIGGSILALLIAQLDDGQPWTAKKTVVLASGVVGILGAAAAADAASQGPKGS